MQEFVLVAPEIQEDLVLALPIMDAQKPDAVGRLGRGLVRQGELGGVASGLDKPRIGGLALVTDRVSLEAEAFDRPDAERSDGLYGAKFKGTTLDMS